MGNPEGVKQAWKRIEAWYSANASEYRGWLRPPADAAAIQRAEAEVKASFPDDFKASLQVHDGQDPNQMEVFGSWAVYPLEKVAQTWKWLQGQVADGSMKTADDPQLQADPSVRPRAWDPQWIPIAAKGTGDYLMMDLDPKDPSRRGQVIAWSPRSSKRTVVAPDFCAWLEQIGKDFESGAWSVDEEGILQKA
jgi:cell wall assembly regulator SMI1